jgi:hypothetical protein
LVAKRHHPFLFKVSNHYLTQEMRTVLLSMESAELNKWISEDVAVGIVLSLKTV